ncbi:hypothetical protein N9S18_00550 [Flavobacteriaceae bacterium]|nr:hypothetical protein [Flavobacteriaceae bacterium]
MVPIVCLLFLIPWGLYTYSKTNHFLINSTNTGHVLFIGLGQLPNNSWGITPRDDDIKMKQILENQFKKGVSSVSFESNEFLKKEFQKLILKKPLEWVKKCFYSFRLILLDPFYVGNVGDFQKNGISNIENIRNLEKSIYKFNLNKSFEILFNTNWEFSSEEVFQLIVTIITKLIGILIFFTALLMTLKRILKFPSKTLNDPFISLILIIVGYQICISIFAFHMPVYNTSIYLIYLILIILLLEKTSFNQTINSN